jgi:hypothetical protein
MTRWKAGAIHLAISLGVAAIAAALIFGLWYPSPYAAASGADTLIELLMGVDVVLGPLLTTIVFVSGKRTLKFDLTVIALLQLAALSYGMWTVAQARPVFLVSTEDRITLVPANLIDPADLDKATLPQFRSLSWTGPKLAGTKLPTDTASQNALLDSALKGKDIEGYPNYYVPYAENAAKLLSRSKPVSLLAGRLNGDAALADLKKRFPDTWEKYTFLPLLGRRFNMAAILDPVTAEPITAYPVDPW